MSFLVACSIAIVIYLAVIAAVVVYVGRGIPPSPLHLPPLPKRRNTMDAFCPNCNSMQPASYRPIKAEDEKGAEAHDLCCNTCHSILTTVTGMGFTEVQKREFEAVAAPVIEWINKNSNPHCTVVITCTSAEFLSGEIAYSTEKFLKD